MAFLIGGANTLTAGYDIDNSLRFNDDDSAVLTREFSGDPDGNRKTFTISFWVKRSTLSVNQTVVSATTTSNFYDKIIGFRSTDNIEVNNVASGNDALQIITNRLYRDISAWYHIVIAIDTTQAAIGDGVKFYVNGVRDTDYDGTPVYTQNATFEIGRDGSTTAIGRLQVNSTQYLDGYLSEFYFIDGTQEAQTAFGEFDEDSGIWKPKEYAGSYGANGFFLEFKASAVGTGASDTIGADTSGQDEHFTSTNVAVTDQTTDTPTNNFMTYNPLSNLSGVPTLSEGNTKVLSDGGDAAVFGTFGLSSGKWYWELKGTETDSSGYQKWTPGVIGAEDHTEYSSNDGGYAPKATALYLGNSNVYQNNSSVSSAYFTAVQNDIIGIALDVDNLKIYWHKNGTYGNSGDPTSGATGTGAIGLTATHAPFIPIVGEGSGHEVQIEANFGNAPFAISSSQADDAGYGNFEYDVPTGYYALCTKNLAEFG